MGCLLLLAALFSFGFWSTVQTTSVEPIPEVSVTESTRLYTDNTGVAIREFASAHNMDEDGCPEGVTTTFRRSEAVYVFAIGTFPRGTTVFARMSYDGYPVEDTDLITADQYYDEVCANFVFEPTIGAEVFDRGPYSIEFFINEMSAGSLDIVIE